VEEHNRQRLVALAIALVSLALALSVARPRTTPGPLMRDFEAYYAAGQAWRTGADPYSIALWQFEKKVPGVRSDQPEVLPFIGPPAFLPLWAALGTLPFAPAVRVWAVLMVVPLLGALAMLLRRLHAWDPGSFLSTAALCVGFGPLTSGFALGQAALPVFGLVVLATGLLATNLLAGGVAAFFAGLQPNLGIALLSQARHRNVLATLGIAVLALLAFGLLFGGFAGFLSYFSALRAHGAAERYALIQFTPSAIAYGFGIPTAAANVLGVVVALAAAAVWIAMMAQRRLTRWWRLAITCALLPFAVPFFHEHDFVIALAPALMCLCAASKRTWAIAAAATMLVGIDWLGLAQRPEALLQSLLLALALLAAIFAFSDQPLGLHRFAILAALLLIPAGLLAQHFPAPIWPDALPAHAITAPSIAAVWNAELRAAHQVAPQPLWAALRLMTLCGAGLLAWCALRTAHRRDQLSGL
jgi:hypothetical protein